MYDKKAHEKAADNAEQLLRMRAPLLMGRPAGQEVVLNVRCTEITLEALQPFCKLKLDRLADVTIGIGAGFSGMGEVCGLISGTIIAFGLDYAARYRDTALLRYFIGKYTQKFMRDFTKEFGSVRCKDLLGGHDLSGYLKPGTDDAYKKFLKYAAEKRPCYPFARFCIMYPLPHEEEDLPPDYLC